MATRELALRGFVIHNNLLPKSIFLWPTCEMALRIPNLHLYAISTFTFKSLLKNNALFLITEVGKPLLAKALYCCKT